MDGMVTTRHAGRWTLADRFSSAWHYLPFEVPAGACAVRVELEYERSGPSWISAAWARRVSRLVRRLAPAFVITPGEATPGYLPGELEAGSGT